MDVKLRGPINRTGSGNLNEPYALHNAEVNYSDSTVEVCRGPAGGAVEGYGYAPHIVWNNEVVQGEGIRDQFVHGSRVYRLTEDGLDVLTQSYSGGDAVYEVPHIKSWDLTRGLQSVDTETGTDSPDAQVWTSRGYVAIPYNRFDERGPALHFSTEARVKVAFWDDLEIAGEEGDDWRLTIRYTEGIEVDFETSPTVSRIDIYRTEEHPTDDSEGYDTYLFLDTISVVKNGAVDIASFVDINLWFEDFDDRMASSLIRIAGQAPRDIVSLRRAYEILVANDFEDVLSATQLAVGTEVYENQPIVYAQRPTGNITVGTGSDSWEMDAPVKFTAETGHIIQGTALYGDVEWPLKLPTLAAYVRTDRPTIDAGKIAVQAEYDDAGEVVYSSVLEVDGVKGALFRSKGDQAIHIWSDNEGMWEYVERLTPGPAGFYRSKKIKDRQQWSWFSGAEITDTRVFYDVSSTVKEKDTVLMAEVNRPASVTFEQFRTPDGESVRSIFPSRLAEEEGLVAYDFIVATARSVFIYQFDAGQRIAQQVERIPVTLRRKYAFAPMFNATAVLGSDQRLYLVQGRQVTQLDVTARGLWGRVYDITFHSANQDLYLLTDTGVWVWDVNVLQGFYKHLTVPSGMRRIEYLKRIVQNAEDSRVVTSTESGNSLLLERAGAYGNNSVTTQSVLPHAREGRINRLSAAYERLRFDLYGDFYDVTGQIFGVNDGAYIIADDRTEEFTEGSVIEVRQGSTRVAQYTLPEDSIESGGETTIFIDEQPVDSGGLSVAKITTETDGGLCRVRHSVRSSKVVPATEDEVADILYGDVNDDGEVTSLDASLVLQHIDGSITLTPEQIERGDVDGDGVLTETDVDLIQQYVAGLIDRFPVEDLVVEGVKARDGRWYFEYQVEDAGTNPSAFIYPKHLVGAGHQLRFKRFDTLYDFTLDMTPAPGEN